MFQSTCHVRATQLMIGIAMLLARQVLVPPARAVEQAPAGLEFVVDLVLGSNEGEDESFFGQVTSVVEDSHGNVYIADWKQECVLKFDSRGKFLRRMGRAGDGPADIMPLFVLAIDAQDRLYIAGQGRRVEIVDGDWNYLASFERVNRHSSPRGVDIRERQVHHLERRLPVLHADGSVPYPQIRPHWYPAGSDLGGRP